MPDLPRFFFGASFGDTTALPAGLASFLATFGFAGFAGLMFFTGFVFFSFFICAAGARFLGALFKLVGAFALRDIVDPLRGAEPKSDFSADGGGGGQERPNSPGPI